jgi:hypothetical protein
MAKSQKAEAAPTNGASDVAVSGTKEITATYNAKDKEGNATGESRKITVTIPEPESLQEAGEVYGEDVVLDLFSRAYDVKAQARIRGLAASGKDDNAIQTEMQTWRPDVSRRVSKDPVAEARKQVTKMSAEQRQEFLALLQASE